MKSSSLLAGFRLCFVGMFCLFSVSISSAQSDPPKTRIITLAYMKPEPGKASEYVQLEREMWKLVHQDMVNKGRLTSWKLYAVAWPNGDEQDYEYVTMMEYPTFGHIESPYAGTDMAAVVGGADKLADMRTKTAAVRTLRRTDTVTVVAATNSWSTASNRVLSVHYLRSLPGKAADLLKIQREHFLPLNEDLIQAGGATAWATTAVRFPQQADFPYNYVSFNAYESLTQIEKQPSQVWSEKWSREKAASVGTQLNASRKRVKGQLWRLVDQTVPRQAVTQK